MPRRIEHKIINGIEMKQCSRCKQILPLSNYSNDRTKWDGLYGFCKECARAKDRKYYKQNKDAVRKRVSDYERKNGLTCKYKKYNPNYYSTEKSKIKKAIRDKKRRESIKRANEENKITEEIVQGVIKKYNGKCAYCGADCSEIYHIDHKIPLCRGGGNEISNLALSCPQCNWSKRTRTDLEFLGRRI